MKTCLKCSKQFKSRIKINGVNKVLGNRKFCLECSPYKKHNTTDLRFRSDSIEKKICPKCNIEKDIEDFYIKDKKTGLRYWCCRKCSSNYTVEKHKKLKIRAVEYKGGKCQICGYDKCMQALIFHHIDPSQKDFTIAQDTSRNWEKIRLEIDKCALLCQNCHSEVHAGIASL